MLNRKRLVQNGLNQQEHNVPKKPDKPAPKSVKNKIVKKRPRKAIPAFKKSRTKNA